jgi:uncharacterized protein YabE (DUF348 family)
MQINLRSIATNSHLVNIKSLLVLLFLVYISLPSFFISNKPRFVGSKKIVQINVDGSSKITTTNADVIGDVLIQNNIELGSGDTVEPGLGTSIKNNKEVVVNVRRAIVSMIVDGDKTIMATSGYIDPRQVVASAGITLYEEDKVSSELVNDFVDQVMVGQKITIKRSLMLKLKVDGNNFLIRSFQNTVADLLKEKNITLGPSDEISQPLATKLESGMEIAIYRISENTKTETVNIPFETDIQLDYSKPVGQETVLVPGQFGQKLITYKVISKDGVESSREEISSNILVSPVKATISRGAKSNFSGSVEYWRPYVVSAANRYGANVEQLMRVMACESGGDASNYNGRSAGLTAAQAMAQNRAIGLFQFLPSTWRGNGGGDIWNGAEQIEKAARLFANGQARQWECR